MTKAGNPPSLKNSTLKFEHKEPSEIQAFFLFKFFGLRLLALVSVLLISLNPN